MNDPISIQTQDISESMKKSKKMKNMKMKNMTMMLPLNMTMKLLKGSMQDLNLVKKKKKMMMMMPNSLHI